MLDHTECIGEVDYTGASVEKFLWALWYCVIVYCVTLSLLQSIVAEWIQTEHSCCFCADVW